MSNIDIDYWLKDIKYGQIRGRVFGVLLELMDKNYQMLNWPEDKGGYGFDTNIGFAIEILFDELDLNENIKVSTTPDRRIGYYFKNKYEMISVVNVCKDLDPLWDESKTDEEYLNSPYLSPMRKTAKECFVVFMDAEKENKEFCDFVLKVIADEKRFIPDKSKSSYDNIVKYTESITEF